MEPFLEKEAAHLAAIVENSADAIISKNLDGIITSWNRAAENMFAFSSSEAIGKPITIIIPPNRIKEEQEIISRIRRGEKIEHYETIRQTRTGITFDISLTVSPIIDRSGRIIGASKIARDISERKRTEKQLEENQLMLKLAMKGNQMGVWERDIASGIFKWSPELEEIFGLKPGELPQDRLAFYEIIQEEDRDRVFSIADEAIEKKKDYFVEFQFIHKDGSVRWMEGRGQASYSADGTPIKFYGSGRDITERKVSEQKLRESEERFRTLADNISQLAWMADSKGWIFWYNKRWFEYTGTTLESMEGWGWKSVHHPDHILRVTERIQKSWDTGERWEDIFPLRGKNGEFRWFLSHALPIRDENGKIVRWFGTNTDITERMEAEESLIAANRAKDEFLSVLSHELRTPLNAILGWTRILKLSAADPAKTQKAIETIERNTNLQNSLIEDLLDVSRIISDKMLIEKEIIDLVAAVKSTLETIQPIADSKQISLEFTSEIESLKIEGDSNRLQQIIVNLLNNSIKFTASGGSVKLNLTGNETTAKLKITDTGIGISPQFLPEIFDRFRQADSTTRRNHSGLGLGLTIVKHLTELHGGKIFAFSEGDGKGSTFTVEFPILFVNDETEKVSDFHTPASLNSEENQPFKNKKIILVDDDRDGIEPLQLFLESYGATITCANSAFSALEILSKNDFDLIISDIGMPQMDGYEFLNKWKDLNKNRATPSIALTAFASAEDRERAIQAGFSYHLPKPINYNSLLLVIGKALDFENPSK